MKGYAICTERRSGSNYLGRLLTSTGVLGRPWEYFDRAAVAASGVTDWPANAEAQVTRILEPAPRGGATANGVYGLKVFSDHFDAVSYTRWPQRLPGLVYVHLERDDVLGQAISLARARATQQWTAGMPAAGEAAFAVGEIRAALNEILTGQMRWRRWFALNDVTPVRLVYEAVMADPQDAVSLIAEALELETPARCDLDQVDVAVQRDAITETWRARFVDLVGDLVRFP